MTQQYVAMWVPAESVNSSVEHGAKFLQLSDILLGQAASTQGLPSTPQPTTRENCAALGDRTDVLDVIVMISEPQATTQGLETSSKPNAPAETPSSGETSNIVYLKLRENTPTRH